MSSSNYSIYQKEYLKKYLSGDVKKKKKKKVSGSNIKRSVIVDDDIDLKSMRALDDDEVELYQMDEDAPQIAGIIDERPPEVKAQEYYSTKRWKVFGGEDGVNVVDTMNKDQYEGTEKNPEVAKDLDGKKHINEKLSSHRKSKDDKIDINMVKTKPDQQIIEKKNHISSDSDFSPPRKRNIDKTTSSNHNSRFEEKYNHRISDASPTRVKKEKLSGSEADSDLSPPRKYVRNSSKDKYDSDASPPRPNSFQKYNKNRNHSKSPPRKDFRSKLPKYSNRSQNREMGKLRSRSDSRSPSRGEKLKKQIYKKYSDNSPSRKEKRPHKRDKSSDSDASAPRRRDRVSKDRGDKSHGRSKRRTSSDSDNSPPRKERRKSPKPEASRRQRSPRSSTPSDKKSVLKVGKSQKDFSLRLSRKDMSVQRDKRYASDSDNSPPRRTRRRSNSSRHSRSDSDLSPSRKTSFRNEKPLKKALYKPNDDSSSDEHAKSKSRKMKTTLDGKQAGLQDARQLKKELSDLKMKEDAIFSKMDASVSGAGAAPVKRDRKTGQVRDLEKEKEAQKEKEAKESVVNEKYYKWGKGIKQTEDAAVRTAEIMKEMNKPLARYVDDQDLDDFLKAQDREGDPMLEYIKSKQSEATSLVGDKPIYKGAWTPNRFNIRPGYRWDGVVRSNGYEKEWFKVQNAKKARDEEAYKWSTSDM